MLNEETSFSSRYGIRTIITRFAKDEHEDDALELNYRKTQAGLYCQLFYSEHALEK